MTGDLALGCVAFALAVGYYLIAATIPESRLADAVGPQGLPKMYAVLLAALALILIVRSLVSTVRLTAFAKATALKKPDTTSAGTSVHAIRRVAGLIAIGAAYVAIVPWLGYIPSVAALIMATTCYQGGALNRQVAGVAMAGAVVFWLLFVKLLGIPQPAGLWPSLL